MLSYKKQTSIQGGFMVTSVIGTTQKPVSSNRLCEYFKKRNDLEGILYIGYPVIGTNEGAYPIDAIWASKEKGLVIFNLIEGKNTSDYEKAQDDSYNKVEARLRGHRELMNKRHLVVEISVITFAPAVVGLASLEDYPLCNEDSIGNEIDKIETWPEPNCYEALVSVLQSVSMIRKNRRKRDIQNTESRGAKLQRIEDSIANLDNEQGRAVIESVEGVQRIRGLAGSGKTIVLALKAAYLHATHPEWRIAVTFNTRSLKDQLKRWISSFYAEQTYSEPDWENLRILHAWGSKSTNGGVYYDFCLKHGVECLDFRQAQIFAADKQPFASACLKAMNDAKLFQQMYDVILVDEAQDLPVEFLKLCYGILGENKRLVYAYDELQSLNLQSLPAPEEIFGTDINGNPRVKFEYDANGQSKQDIILEKCYRNSRQALTIAHALGFGIYRSSGIGFNTGIVQMFDQHKLWTDIGYKVVDGALIDGEKVLLKRTQESSPSFLENHSDADDLVFCMSFESRLEQDEWVANQIIKNIREEELRADDIMVINPDPMTTREAVGRIRKRLYEAGIDSHIAGVDCSPDIFFDAEKDSVTFTGIYRAKGNEAAMVYIINSNDCNAVDFFGSLRSIAIQRNRLFTAITRSKAWVRILGVGNQMISLIDEINEVKKHNYQLEFVYPNASQRKKMNIINRDMSQAEFDRVKNSRKSLQTVLADLEAGEIYIEDLGQEYIDRLRKLLEQGGNE